jgi:ParB family chromosome partitioning protein
LEEDQVIDGTATQLSPNAGQRTAPTNRSTEGGRLASSQSVATESDRNALASAATAARPPARSGTSPAMAATATSDEPRRTPSTGVTGSVPLRRKESTSAEMDELSNAAKSTHTTLEINVEDIENNPFQPRRKFHEAEIASLAESIREHEQLQPILVRRIGNRFQLISGERRLRATIHAGLTTIRAEVREADDRLVAELAIVENLQRKDLDAIEKALSFRRYIDEHKCRQDDLAKRLKIDRSTIANLMRLLELPAQIQQWVQEDKLTAGHARTLLPLGNESQQMEFAKLIMEEGWTVRDTEHRVNEQLLIEDGAIAGRTSPAGRTSTRKKTSPQVAALEQQMRLSLGTKTEIRQSASGRGKITISFANNEEFERIRSLICPVPEQRKTA